jgi:hypothetical protein
MFILCNAPDPKSSGASRTDTIRLRGRAPARYHLKRANEAFTRPATNSPQAWDRSSGAGLNRASAVIASEAKQSRPIEIASLRSQ